ncbi:uncharacterized mitochondrial protein AtMg00860-like [Arachis hypogaea]|uniref:uncharacterized mitochondrial protein AtMg00860-like n=1 Tax=Arachis hypogaea TaxID=3818 RepID=UPI003B2223CA
MAILLVYNSSFDSHLEHLELVLKLLRQKTLFAKLSKCLFETSDVEYLGYTIIGGSVLMESAKVQTIQDWCQPSSVNQLRAFLGLTGYYYRFIKGYATLASPLTNLLKEDVLFALIKLRLHSINYSKRFPLNSASTS